MSNYHQQIEVAFNIRRGKNQLLNTLDYQQIEVWYKEQIPLQVIIDAFEEGFKKRNDITSLRYFIPLVKQKMQMLEKAHVGRNSVESIMNMQSDLLDEYRAWSISKQAGFDLKMIEYGKAYYKRIHGDCEI